MNKQVIMLEDSGLSLVDNILGFSGYLPK